MSPLWRKLFLYVGIFIAVFGMRLLLPIVLVSVTAQLSIPEVWDLALYGPEAYAASVESAAEAIYTFGGDLPADDLPRLPLRPEERDTTG